MAIKVNQSTSDGSGSGSGKLYTGVASMKVLAINPTQEQLKSFGYKAEKAPVYKDDKGVRVDVHVEAKVSEKETVKTKLAFFLKPKKVESIFINKQGKFAADRTKVGDGARNPYQGEMELLFFLQAWCDIKKDEELFLDSIDRIVNAGDVTELRQIAANAKENVFKGLLYVREGKYQSVYTGKLEKGWSKSNEYIFKDLVRQEQHLDGYYGPIDFKLYSEDQFALRSFDRKPETATANAPSSNGQGTHNDAAAVGTQAPNDGKEDETPF